MRYALVLIVAIVGLSALADRGAGSQRIATGTVADVHEGEWMLVTNDGMSLPVNLGETTAYDSNPAALKIGVRVTVWYRNVGERRLVADKVRVLRDVATR
jgi:hypothetical protein